MYLEGLADGDGLRLMKLSEKAVMSKRSEEGVKIQAYFVKISREGFMFKKVRGCECFSIMMK